jgi:DNA-binding NarL/FixJ family response regulator
MIRLILADNQAIFRAGAARTLALEDDMRIVSQCEDMPRLYSAIETFRNAVILLSSTLRPEPRSDLKGDSGSNSRQDLRDLIVRTAAADSRVILITENAEQVPDELAGLLDGILCRNVTGSALVDCVRCVGRGQRFVQRSNVTTMQVADTVGTRVRDRLTPKEMQIVALIVQGCKNKDIATQLGTKEQVIKNYLRSIYDKTGVSDRLELALFTIHHRVLAEAAERAASNLHMKSA